MQAGRRGETWAKTESNLVLRPGVFLFFFFTIGEGPGMREVREAAAEKTRSHICGWQKGKRKSGRKKGGDTFRGGSRGGAGARETGETVAAHLRGEIFIHQVFFTDTRRLWESAAPQKKNDT